MTDTVPSLPPRRGGFHHAYADCIDELSRVRGGRARGGPVLGSQLSFVIDEATGAVLERRRVAGR
jgi:hypothetical protein